MIIYFFASAITIILGILKPLVLLAGKGCFKMLKVADYITNKDLLLIVRVCWILDPCPIKLVAGSRVTLAFCLSLYEIYTSCRIIAMKLLWTVKTRDTWQIVSFQSWPCSTILQIIGGLKLAKLCHWSGIKSAKLSYHLKLADIFASIGSDYWIALRRAKI